jgi:hypothetical protein
MYARTANKPRPRTAQVTSFAAPIAGWIANRALAIPQSAQQGPGAAVLDNYFPLSSSVKLRRGRQTHVTLAETTQDVASMFSYRNGNNRDIFAANDTKIYRVTSVATSVVTGKTGGDWSTTQFATTGGVFLVGVNGLDTGFLYDGTTWAALAVTFSGGVTTADMSHVWVYKNRLWFVEKDSLNVWYMAVDAIAGAATIFPLAGVLPLGGSMMFGQTWSLEGGAEGGLSEQCIFVSSEGEVAVYQGDDPAAAATWQKVGVYRIGRPVGKRAFFRGGGDLAIATSVGLIPLSKAISLDITALTAASVSFNISDAWQEAIRERGMIDWQCALWPEEKMAIVAPPNPAGINMPVLFVVNAETGAWCRFTNWTARSMEVFEGRLYVGSENGEIFLANVGGSDEGVTYTGVIVPLFNDLGSPASLKVGKMARGVSRSSVSVNARVTMTSDFSKTVPAPPNASNVVVPSVWGTGVWGTSIWGGFNSSVINQGWASIGGTGYALSLVYQVTSGSVGPVDDELIRLDMTYTVGEAVT